MKIVITWALADLDHGEGGRWGVCMSFELPDGTHTPGPRTVVEVVKSPESPGVPPIVNSVCAEPYRAGLVASGSEALS